MGELSKSIGEKGEEIAKFLFEEVLGYPNIETGIKLNCIHNLKHKSSSAKGERQTHGIDGFISYASPVEDEVLDLVIMSSKYTKNPYPSITKTKSTFKNHLKDLTQTYECFSNSQIRNGALKQFNGIKRSDTIGVLVWLSEDSPNETSIIGEISNSIIEFDMAFDSVIIVDNARINFLYNSILSMRRLEGNDNLDFVYINNSLNPNSYAEEPFGKTFPIHYLYSDIIPMRIAKEGKIELHIYINMEINEFTAEQIIGLASSINTLGALNKTVLNFKNYSSLDHETTVKGALRKFRQFQFDKNFYVQKFPKDFKN
ncbi:hypothetical protein MUB18_14465 [Sphingobacterium sp. PCS056]|uniref:GapS4a family protein n=1 Tax=Sphingobacterium sp. PCS056 TaxID=2931400 RepID=UPI00200DB0F3|nr:hypothetical protein [Sphingobacterium sp. PCS056]UPZ35310.1 hypothetical protein MUB18_14465 [Sphingobacterium sp. PCS056]